MSYFSPGVQWSQQGRQQGGGLTPSLPGAPRPDLDAPFPPKSTCSLCRLHQVERNESRDLGGPAHKSSAHCQGGSSTTTRLLGNIQSLPLSGLRAGKELEESGAWPNS